MPLLPFASILLALVADAVASGPAVDPSGAGPGRASVLDRFAHLMGVLPDAEIARLAGTTMNNVRAYRFRRRHPAGHVPTPSGAERRGRPAEPGSVRSAILGYLADHGPTRALAIVEAVAPGVDEARRYQIMSQVSRLAREGKIRRIEHGLYSTLAEPDETE